jgi:hypothetical protein
MVHAEGLGAYEGRTAVSIDSDRVPEWVIIDLPDFWDQPNLEVSYVELGENGVYSENVVDSRDEFPGRLRRYGG